MIEVLNVQKSIQGMYGKCDVVNVRIDNDVYHLSRYPDETKWYVDACFKKGWMPHFVHGTGSRCCKKDVAKGELLVAIEDAAG